MALLSVLMMTAGLGATQDPSLDLQIAAPVFSGEVIRPTVSEIKPVWGFAFTGPEFAVPGQPAWVEGQPIFPVGFPQGSVRTEVSTGSKAAIAQGSKVAAGPKVSVAFRDASPKEVFQWFERQGVNFVVAKGQVPEDARLTLNLKDQPLDSALEAISAALGGHWEMNGGIRVFKKGPKMQFFAPSQEFRWNSKDGKYFPLGDEFGKDISEMLRDLPKKMNFDGLDPKVRDEITRAFEEMNKELGAKGIEGPRVRIFQDRIQPGNPPSLRERTGERIIERFESRIGERLGGRLAPQMKVDGAALLKSMTPAQKETQRKRGFLSYSDLTPEQKKMLGDRPTGKFEIRFKIDQDEVVIRGE